MQLLSHSCYYQVQHGKWFLRFSYFATIKKNDIRQKLLQNMSNKENIARVIV